MPVRRPHPVPVRAGAAVVVLGAAIGLGALTLRQSQAPSQTLQGREQLQPPRSATAGPSLQPEATPAAPTGPAGSVQPTPAPTPLPVPAVAALAGCPPPPSTPPPYVPPWRPAVLVPDAQLPAPLPPSGADAALGALGGKGMWIWRFSSTEGGDARAIVDRAVGSGLRQLWVRVADSRDGFYAGRELAALVPAAHRAGLAVIAWGFPHLYDPVADAAWSAQVLDWRAPGGARVDGFSADIETDSEGVALSPQRAAVYLGLVRQGRGGRPLVATVFPPNEHWSAVYPYAAMAPYVDAFAPMLYWECREPGAAAEEAVNRLGAMRPVHVIGQAFTMADVGGRREAPSGAELERFMGVARRNGAVGASFWVWQDMTAEEWTALGAYPWEAPAAEDSRHGAPS